MAWVRYDDGFDGHPKVTFVIAEDPGAIALHTLANTWSSRTSRPGFVPKHQPGVLLADKRKGNKWAALLVKSGLWHEVEGGYEFHDHADYRPPARERVTPGTPSELSKQRREAGRKGGRASAARRDPVKQTARANQANGVSKTGQQDSTEVSNGSNASSNSVSPVVGSSTELTLLEEPTPEPVPPTAGVASLRHPIHAGTVIAAYMDGAKAGGQPAPVQSLRNRVGKQANELIAAAKTDSDLELILEAAHDLGRHGWQDLTVQVQRTVADRRAAAPRQSTTDQRVLAGDAVAARMRLIDERMRDQGATA